MDENTNVTAEDNGAGVENTTEDSNQQGQNKEKTYNEKEFQSEIDKRVAGALKTAREKWQEEYDAKLKSEKDEAARLAKMTAEERSKEEFNKRVKEFEEREAKHNAERLEFECTKQLAAAGLPIEFAGLLTGKDAEETKSNIDSFEKAYSKAIEAAVNEKLKGKPPKVGKDNEEQTDPFLQGFGGV